MSLIGNPNSAEWYRTQYTDISDDGILAAGGGDATLVSGKTGWTIFIQRIIAYITTDAAQSASFEDDTATPIQVANIPASPGDDTRWDFDFGARGKPLGESKDFELNVSAAGLAMHFEWEGYMRQTGVEYIRNAGTAGSGQAFQ